VHGANSLINYECYLNTPKGDAKGFFDKPIATYYYHYTNTCGLKLPPIDAARLAYSILRIVQTAIATNKTVAIGYSLPVFTLDRSDLS
jgi:hypothetical protein